MRYVAVTNNTCEYLYYYQCFNKCAHFYVLIN